MPELNGTLTHDADDAVMKYHLPSEGWRFEWNGYEGGRGGPYIEVYQGSESTSFEVINTASADSDEFPAFTEDNFLAEIEEWYTTADLDFFREFAKERQ